MISALKLNSDQCSSHLIVNDCKQVKLYKRQQCVS